MLKKIKSISVCMSKKDNIIKMYYSVACYKNITLGKHVENVSLDMNVEKIYYFSVEILNKYVTEKSCYNNVFHGMYIKKI